MTQENNFLHLKKVSILIFVLRVLSCCSNHPIGTSMRVTQFSKIVLRIFLRIYQIVADILVVDLRNNAFGLLVKL